MRLLLVLGLFVGVAALAGDPPREVTEAPEAAADTLRYQLTAGQSLVVPLPGGDDVTFRGVRLPALSWLVDGTFAWRTLHGEVGREYVLIQRRGSTRTDTLVLVIDVE